MQKTAVNFDHLSMVAEVIVFNGCAKEAYHGGSIAITSSRLSGRRIDPLECGMDSH